MLLSWKAGLLWAVPAPNADLACQARYDLRAKKAMSRAATTAAMVMPTTTPVAIPACCPWSTFLKKHAEKSPRHTPHRSNSAVMFSEEHVRDAGPVEVQLVTVQLVAGGLGERERNPFRRRRRGRRRRRRRRERVQWNSEIRALDTRKSIGLFANARRRKRCTH